MGGITSDEYEMELAKLVEQARRLEVQADMLAAKAGDDMSEDVADMLGAALGDGMQDGLVHRLRNDSSDYEEFGRRVAAAFGEEADWWSDMLDVIEELANAHKLVAELEVTEEKFAEFGKRVAVDLGVLERWESDTIERLVVGHAHEVLGDGDPRYLHNHKKWEAFKRLNEL